MKALIIKRITKQSHIQRTEDERRILEIINYFLFIVELMFTFLNLEKIFFGEKKRKKFKRESVMKYTSQIVLALEYLHNNNINYTDLKPEKILIDKEK